MIEIAGSLVEESFTEYAVDSPWAVDALIECDTLAEAEAIAEHWGGRVLSRRVYVTEYQAM